MQKPVPWANLKPVFRLFMEVCMLQSAAAEKNTEACTKSRASNSSEYRYAGRRGRHAGLQGDGDWGIIPSRGEKVAEEEFCS